MTNYITLKQYLMGRDVKYPKEYAYPITINAIKLLSVVNEMLNELATLEDIYDEMFVNSGWRPASLNATIKNAAKASLHTTGLAVDIKDVNGSLYKAIQLHPELLIKYRLWMEHIDATPGWCHLDLSTTRKDRPIRIFKP